MLVLCLTGEKLGGKTTFSQYLADNYDAEHYRFSGILDDLLARLHLPNSRDNQIAIVQSLRKEFGTELLAHVLKKDIQKQEKEIAVIDGIRFEEELHILKNLSNFHLVYITAPLEERYKRAKNRGEKVGEENQTFEDFKAQEEAPTEQKIKALGEDAEFKIDNDATLEDYFHQIEKVYKEIKQKNESSKG